MRARATRPYSCFTLYLVSAQQEMRMARRTTSGVRRGVPGQADGAEGTNSLGLDRFVWLKQPERSRPRHGELEIIQFHWNVAFVLLAAALIRAIGAQHSDARCLDRAADFEPSALPPMVGPRSFEPKRPRRKGAGSSFVDWEPFAPVKN